MLPTRRSSLASLTMGPFSSSGTPDEHAPMSRVISVSVNLAHFSWHYVTTAQISAALRVFSWGSPFQMSRALITNAQDCFLCLLCSSLGLAFFTHQILCGPLCSLCHCVYPLSVSGQATLHLFTRRHKSVPQCSELKVIFPSQIPKRGIDVHAGTFAPRELENAVESLSGFKINSHGPLYEPSS